MMKVLLELVGSALSLWEHKDKNKYINEFIKLKQKYYEEYNKPPHLRSDAVLDNLEFDLRLYGYALSAAIGRTNTENK
jgi:hypothetical protein